VLELRNETIWQSVFRFRKHASKRFICPVINIAIHFDIKNRAGYQRAIRAVCPYAGCLHQSNNWQFINNKCKKQNTKTKNQRKQNSERENKRKKVHAAKHNIYSDYYCPVTM